MRSRGFCLKKYIYFSVLCFLSACGSHESKLIPVSFRTLPVFPPELLSDQIEPDNGGTIKNKTKNKALHQQEKSLKGFRKIQIPLLKFELLKTGHYLPTMVGAETLTQYHQPHVPILTFRIPSKNQTKIRIKLRNLKLEESVESVPVSQSSQLYVWGRGKGFVEKAFVSEDNQSSKKYYPGKIVETHQEKNVLIVNLFPVQIERQTGKVLKLSSAELETVSQESLDETSEEPEKKVPSISIAKETEGLIITSKALLESAKDLQSFHRDSLKKLSQIVTVEEVGKRETPVDHSELPEGYTSPEWFEGIILSREESPQGYDFELAKKLISFLRKSVRENSQIKYVTLLGNARIIPPSYYFKRRGNLGISRAGVTDQCYAAGEMCLKALVSVGRLPFENDQEVQAYLTKAQRWLVQNQKSTSDISLWGGKAFPHSPFYIGELGALEVLSSFDFGWKNTEKFFQTEKNFNRQTQERLFSGNMNSALVYYLDHGLGNRLFAGEDSISSSDILKMDAKNENAPPVVASVSCINAAFDEPILLDDTLEEKDEFGSVSIGTALLKSPQGAIAYLGGTREGLGSPETLVDSEGNVKVLGTSYGLQLLEDFIHHHQRGHQGTLGEALLGALNSYTHENGNDMDEFFHRYTFWITELLGDPAMPMPFIQGGEKNWQSPSSRFDVLKEEMGMPQMDLEDLDPNAKPFRVFSQYSRFSAKVYKMELGRSGFSGEHLVKEIEIDQLGESDLSSQISSALEQNHQYLVKLTNLSGVPKEQHVVFRTQGSIK